MEKTIYSDEIWERMLEKYPKMKEAAIKCGVVNNPDKAHEISKLFNHNFGLGILSDDEHELGLELKIIQMKEKFFVDHVAMIGTFHHENGADDYAIASLELIINDFEDSFNDWRNEIKKRNISQNASFSELYMVFLDVIQLKIKYKVPYTKLFVRKLLNNSAMPREDLLEVKEYFLKEDPKLLPELELND